MVTGTDTLVIKPQYLQQILPSNNLDFGIDHDPQQLGAAGSFAEATNVYVNATAGVIGNPPALSNWNNTVSTQNQLGYTNHGSLSITASVKLVLMETR